LRKKFEKKGFDLFLIAAEFFVVFVGICAAATVVFSWAVCLRHSMMGQLINSDPLGWTVTWTWTKMDLNWTKNL